MIQSPFIPFIITFCYIIETSEASDLEYLRRLVETLESATDLHAHNMCDRQRRLFRAFYDVAAKYVEVKSRTNDHVSGGQGSMSWAAMTQQPQQYVDASGAPVGQMPPSHGDVSQGPDEIGLVDGYDGTMEMEMDFSGAQLWDWFNKNQNMMRMLEDA